MSALLDAALAYAERDIAVFPLRGKLPLIAQRNGGQGHKDATKDPAKIRAWWRRRPTANIGIATGAISGLFVVDVDPQHGGDVELRRLVELYGALPETAMVRTGGGGYHRWYRHEQGIGSGVSRIGPGVDHRGDGGYIVAPPSVHPVTREVYAFLAGYRLEDVGIGTAPPWLVDAARKREIAEVIGTPGTCTELCEYSAAALRSAAKKILAAPNGAQEVTLNGESYSIGRLAGAGVVPTELALDILLTAARAIPSYDRRRPWRVHEVEMKVRRAFVRGTTKPMATLIDYQSELDRMAAEAIDV